MSGWRRWWMLPLLFGPIKRIDNQYFIITYAGGQRAAATFVGGRRLRSSGKIALRRADSYVGRKDSSMDRAFIIFVSATNEIHKSSKNQMSKSEARRVQNP
jgi:hypothetical protein